MSQAVNLTDTKNYPRRWIGIDGKRGCYFPSTDLLVGEGGGRGTGAPHEKGLVWLDPVDDLPWIQPP